jgi:hypothetical protein
MSEASFEYYYWNDPGYKHFDKFSLENYKHYNVFVGDQNHGIMKQGYGEYIYTYQWFWDPKEEALIDTSMDLVVVGGIVKEGATLGAGLATNLLRSGGKATVQGLYGSIPSTALRIAADSGDTVSVFTRLTQPPMIGRPLSVSVGNEALANASRAGGQLYKADISRNLIELMKGAGLAEERVTLMGGTSGREIFFQPQATEFIVKNFRPVN